jgi:hypothetical protein
VVTGIVIGSLLAPIVGLALQLSAAERLIRWKA